MKLETERLLLRPFLEGDGEDVLEYLREPAVSCFAEMKLSSFEEAREEMKRRAGEAEYYFSILRKQTGNFIVEINTDP